ncbi:MAG: TIGR02266 family protein [Acidobacteria bacterium]|nr:MAG: TIGR02266 family protein [Acidobacteriota bacterium]
MSAELSGRKTRASASQRIPVRTEIDVRFPHFQGFVTGISSDLSTTGMFIESDRPQPVGTVFAFKFHIEDWELIQGTARVIWTRERAEGKNRPPGMGVQFIDLDAQSRRMVRWLVEKHIDEGGQPFDLAGDLPETASRLWSWSRPTQWVGRRRSTDPLMAGDFEEAPTLDLAEPDAVSTTGLRPIHGIALLILVLLWGYMIGRGFVEDQASAVRAPGRLYRIAAESVEALRSVFGQAPAPATFESAFTPEPQPEPGAIFTDLVENWSTAWAQQRMDDYLSYYAQDFQPGGGMSRADWRAFREDRVLGPEYIFMAISGLNWKQQDDEKAETTFIQTYRSDRYSDTVLKTLDLVWEDNHWKILRERVRGEVDQEPPANSP